MRRRTRSNQSRAPLVIETLGQERHLAPIAALNEALHSCPTTHLRRVSESRHANPQNRAFLHSQGQNLPSQPDARTVRFFQLRSLRIGKAHIGGPRLVSARKRTELADEGNVNSPPGSDIYLSWFGFHLISSPSASSRRFLGRQDLRHFASAVDETVRGWSEGSVLHCRDAYVERH